LGARGLERREGFVRSASKPLYRYIPLRRFEDLSVAIGVPLLTPTEWAAQIDPNKTPEDQLQALLHIQGLLTSLVVFERRLVFALLLFDASYQENWKLVRAAEIGHLDFQMLDRATDTLGGWQSIAAREAIRHSLPSCPALNALVDHTVLRTAHAQFRKEFPRIEAVRHVVAHVADFTKTAELKDEHSKKGPYKLEMVEAEDADSSAFFAGNPYGRTYHVTYKGEFCQYDITDESVAKLRAIKNLIYSAMAAISTPGPLR
jgi:hypothetical protein